MPTLTQHLAALSHQDLRAIATRLHLRQRDQHTKTDWIDQIARLLSDPDRLHSTLAQLSGRAQHALQRLIEHEDLPARLFFVEYGSVRRATSARHNTAKPWRQPQTASEELYYSGLLHPTDARPIHKAARLTVPFDLRPILRNAITHGDSSPPLLPLAALCHDLAQLLLYLHTHPNLPLRHGRWLTAPHLAGWQARMIIPGDPTTSHRQDDRLALLMFLSVAAELQVGGVLTAHAWAWLALPLPDQFTAIWRAWCSAPNALRDLFGLASAALSPAGLSLFIDCLATRHSPFSAAQLAGQMLSTAPNLTSYFNLQFADLSDLDQIIGQLLQRELAGCGVVTLTESPGLDEQWFAVTAHGAWLLNQPDAALPFIGEAPAPTATLIEQQEPPVWRINIPTGSPLHAQATLANYATHLEMLRTTDASQHVYQLDRQTIAAAAERSRGLPALLSALQQMQIELAPAQLLTLHHWHAAGQTTAIHTLPILRTTQPEQMQTLLQEPKLRQAIGEVLSPTVAILASAVDEFSETMRSVGFHVQTSTATQQPAPEGSATVDRASIAALWLAAQTYALLGQHMPLPMPPAFTSAAQLYMLLSAEQRATVEIQLLAVEQSLRQMLDGQTFAPAPHFTEPQQWLAQIDQAISQQRPLEIDYFSAGRNLLTRRRIDPFWLEHFHGVAYLRAHCHQAQRVLLFRLDRIQQMITLYG